MKRCPYCSEEIQENAIECKHCGEWQWRVETTSSQGDIPEIDPSAFKVCPVCHAIQDNKETECPNCDYDLTKIKIYTQSTRPPSLKSIVLTLLLYLFGAFTITLVLGFMTGVIGTVIGFHEEKLISFAEFIDAVVPLFISLVISIFLVKRYSRHFFSGSWKTNLYSRFRTGLKWSILYIVIIGIATFNPVFRAEWLKDYLLTSNLSLENVTIIIVILISLDILVATFLEELIYRGMIQQYIKKFITPRKSILITAGIFTMSHFQYFFIVPVSLRDVFGWFLVGIFTGFAFNKYNSCISSFIPHLAYNLRFIIIVPLMLV